MRVDLGVVAVLSGIPLEGCLVEGGYSGVRTRRERKRECRFDAELNFHQCVFFKILSILIDQKQDLHFICVIIIFDFQKREKIAQYFGDCLAFITDIVPFINIVKVLLRIGLKSGVKYYLAKLSIEI